MARLLILMYILEANGTTIPTGCYIAALTCLAVHVLALLTEHILRNKI